ncbi:hypothetical protein LJC45_03105 [Alistipes sp. OttesenSCG-928-B03]|nr:hypothetical protein [Alistipes sp. OttesenSCG-928-B03]
MKCTFLLALILVLCGCGNRNSREKTISAIEQTEPTISTEPAIKEDTPLSFMKNHIGKYPSDIDFFNIPDINTRLQNLAGENWEQISKCHVEFPIKAFEDDFIHVSVCFPHECDMVYCKIYLNHATDNISLYYRNYKKRYYLSENGVIGSELKQWKERDYP